MKISDLKLPEEKLNLLEKMSSRVGDLNFKRRVITMLSYLDIKDGDRILDAGCGEGFYTMLISNLWNCEITAIDNDTVILSKAKKWLPNSNKITVRQESLYDIKSPDDYFDKVLCTEVIEHLDDDIKAVNELKRILKTGGILALTVPNKNYPLLWDPFNKIRESLGLGHFSPLNGFWGGIWAYDHKRLYSPKDIESVVSSCGFDVKKTEVITHYGVPFNHLVLYVGKNLYDRMPVSEDMKKSMEKFEWKDSNKKSLWRTLLEFAFGILKKVDSFNEKDFSLNTSTMAVSVHAIKK
jgi:SAM-dependent methyltransferase